MEVNVQIIGTVEIRHDGIATDELVRLALGNISAEERIRAYLSDTKATIEHGSVKLAFVEPEYDDVSPASVARQFSGLGLVQCTVEDMLRLVIDDKALEGRANIFLHSPWRKPRNNRPNKFREWIAAFEEPRRRLIALRKDNRPEMSFFDRQREPPCYVGRITG